MKKNLMLLFLFPLLLHAQFNEWNKLNDTGMGKRERAVGFAVMGLGYLCGGQDTAEVIHKDLWAYDPLSDTWTQKADLPGSARRDAVSFVIGNYAYVGAGMDSVSAPSGITLKDFWRYNPLTNAWTAVADFPGMGGNGVYFSTGFAVAGKGYICGGKTGSATYSAQFWEYKPSNNQWIQRASFPGGVRYQMASFVVGSKAYVGMGVDQNIYKKDMYCYDPGANLWTPIAPFPAYERGAASSFSLEDRGFICLGNNGGLLGDLIEYNPKTNSWTLRAAFGGSERKSAIAFTIGNIAYVGTGKGYSGKKASFYEYAPCDYAGIEALENNLSIYPNPCQDHLTINGLSQKIERIEVLNTLGKTMLLLNYQSNSMQSVYLDQLEAGNYILRFISTDGQTISRKIIKL
ncbi:MAG: kelch repeat-containing protein [Flavobacteriales bacterium]